jgi:hypothetical protein
MPMDNKMYCIKNGMYINVFLAPDFYRPRPSLRRAEGVLWAAAGCAWPGKKEVPAAPR